MVFTKDLTNVELTEMNVVATFECELSKTGLRVDWFKGYLKLRADDKYKITADEKRHVLTVCDVTDDDIGEYRATYDKLVTSAKLTLAVPPSLAEHEYSDKLTVKAGSNVTIEIPFRAYPLPTAAWQYKGGKLPDKRRFQSDCISCLTTMVIAKVKPSDKGPYTVEIANKHGRCTFTIELIVIDKPSAPENLKVTDVTDRSVSLTWEEPQQDGGAHVFNYVIEKREGSLHRCH